MKNVISPIAGASMKLQVNSRKYERVHNHWAVFNVQKYITHIIKLQKTSMLIMNAPNETKSNVMMMSQGFSNILFSLKNLSIQPK